MSGLARAVLGAVLVVVSGCAGLFERPEASFTCAQWLSLSAASRTEVASLIIDSEDVLEGVRKAQRREPGTPRVSLIEDVVGSTTKNCEFPGQDARPVAALAMELYGGGRKYDGQPGQAP
jgi:hypothetical protein